MLPFLKMQGAGNDFIVLDSRNISINRTLLNIAHLADRRTGIGCDQVIWLESSNIADIKMRIFNSDGTEVAACGNATRCVGWLIMQEHSTVECRIETQVDVLSCSRESTTSAYITADMGKPRWDWQEIPLAQAEDTLHLPIEGAPTAVSMGNPHMVFFVEDVAAIALAEIGPQLEHHPLFPQRTNVEFVQVLAPNHLLMRVWERGSGITQACGTGACASLVAASRRGLAQDSAIVSMPGGDLQIKWHKSKEKHWITMAGEVYTSFRGEFAVEDYAHDN